MVVGGAAGGGRMSGPSTSRTLMPLLPLLEGGGSGGGFCFLGLPLFLLVGAPSVAGGEASGFFLGLPRGRLGADSFFLGLPRRRLGARLLSDVPTASSSPSGTGGGSGERVGSKYEIFKEFRNRCSTISRVKVVVIWVAPRVGVGGHAPTTSRTPERAS